MARSEARLAVSIWTDQDFKGLTPTAQRMFMFLLSQPDLAHDGVIALRERRWSTAAAGLTVADVAQDLDALRAARFVVIDDDTEELLIRSFIRRDKVFKQPNVLRAAADHLEVVTSPVILAEIAAELRRITETEEVTEGSASIIAEMLEALAKAIGKGSRNPSNTPSPGGSGGTPGERGVVTVVPQGVSPFPVPQAPSPVPRAAPAAPPREPAKRGTRLPDDFTVTPEMVEWAREHTPHVNGKWETEQFRDHWAAASGSNATKRDWAAAWRTWMRKAAGSGPTGRASPGVVALRGDQRPSTSDLRVAQARAAGAEAQAILEGRAS